MKMLNLIRLHLLVTKITLLGYDKPSQNINKKINRLNCDRITKECLFALNRSLDNRTGLAMIVEYTHDLSDVKQFANQLYFN